MEEKDELKLKLIKHLIYNITVFITIFLFFGLFVFIMVRNIVYGNVDNELYKSRKQIIEMENIKDDFSSNSFFDEFDRGFEIFDILEQTRDLNLIRQIVNPDVNIIIRNNNGQIAREAMGRIEEYSEEIEFDINNLDKIYELTIAKHYHYRAINVYLRDSNPEEGRYIQLLINVDSERNLINNYVKILLSALIICLILSIVASYILSKKTLQPLRDNMIKQMEFVQNVSHELRTPLTIIQAKQELLLQEPNSKIIDKSEDIALTLNETKRLSRLVKDLLTISRADNDNMKLQKEDINLDEYITEIARPYIEIAEIEEKEILFNLNYGADIQLDTNKFYQLIVILLDNAIKYTESNDKIEICTYEKDNKCVIEVKDTGIGVSEQGLKRIFERFYREDEARNRETGGTGLGLSIANIIVSSHGGTIKASHNTPKGTIFTIKLPK